MSTTNYDSKLSDFFEGDVPEYIHKAGKTFITIIHSDVVTGMEDIHKVKIEDVVKFYADRSWSMDSRRFLTVLSLGGIIGDHRPMRDLAQLCVEWFKYVNRNELVRIGKKYNMQPRGW